MINNTYNMFLFCVWKLTHGSWTSFLLTRQQATTTTTKKEDFTLPCLSFQTTSPGRIFTNIIQQVIRGFN